MPSNFRKMNILFAADVSIAGVVGGAERVLFEQSTRLARRGHSVHVLTRRLPSHASDRETISLVPEWRYAVDLQSPLSYFAATLKNARACYEDLQKTWNFDFINSHQPFTSYAVLRSPAARNVKKIYTCHSLSFEEFKTRNTEPQRLTGKLFYLLNLSLRRYMESRSLNESDLIVVLSRFTHDKLINAYGVNGDKIRIIPGGADLDKFHPAENRRNIRTDLKIPLNRIVLLTVRNLVSRMGLENLVTAMKAVAHKVPEAYLVLAGKGPLKNDLMNLTEMLGLEGHISFVGFIPEESLSDYYSMADLFILPTRELEGFGLVTVEALASGTPVLGTPVGGTLEILEAFEPGWLFRDTRPESIAELIIEKCLKIRKEPGWRDRIGIRCREFAETKYSWEKNVDSFESLLQD